MSHVKHLSLLDVPPPHICHVESDNVSAVDISLRAHVHTASETKGSRELCNREILQLYSYNSSIASKKQNVHELERNYSGITEHPGKDPSLVHKFCTTQ